MQRLAPSPPVQMQPAPPPQNWYPPPHASYPTQPWTPPGQAMPQQAPWTPPPPHPMPYPQPHPTYPQQFPYQAQVSPIQMQAVHYDMSAYLSVPEVRGQFNWRSLGFELLRAGLKAAFHQGANFFDHVPFTR